MWFYRILFTFDALVVLVLAWFFLTGLQYGPSGSYMAIWLPLLGIPAALIAGGWHFRTQGKTGVALLLLGLLAIPAVLFIAFFGILIAIGPNWH